MACLDMLPVQTRPFLDIDLRRWPGLPRCHSRIFPCVLVAASRVRRSVDDMFLQICSIQATTMIGPLVGALS